MWAQRGKVQDVQHAFKRMRRR